MFQLAGVDSENLTEDHLSGITDRIKAAKNSLPEGSVLYEYLIKKRGFVFVDRPDVNRCNFLSANASLGSVNLYWVVLFPAPKSGTLSLAVVAKAVSVLKQRIEDSIILDAHQAAAVFSYILNLEESASITHLNSAHNVDQQIVRNDLTCQENHLKIGKRKYAQLFSMVGRPQSTGPNIWGSLLNLDCDVVLRSRWIRKPTPSVRSAIGSYETFMAFFRQNIGATAMSYLTKEEMPRNAAAVAGEKATDTLAEILHEVEDLGHHYGEYSLIGMVHDSAPEKLNEAMLAVRKIFEDKDAVILEETEGVLSAYYALFPGNEKFDVRGAWLQDGHAANMSFIYAPNIGQPYSKDMRRESLAIFETRDVTPLFFDPFVSGARGTFIGGQTGYGKSFLAQFLLQSELKYDSFIYIFDVGGSYDSLVKSAGGVSTKIGLHGPRINPFCLEPTDDNIHFLFELIRMLIVKGGGKVALEKETKLSEKIRDMYLFPVAARRLRNLALPPEMAVGLKKWTNEGMYANTFDAEVDDLHLAKIQAFDFSLLGSKNNDLIEMILYWITHRITATVEDQDNLSCPKHLLFDEIWKLMQNPTILEKAIETGKTGRKNRAGVTVCTQTMEDLGAHKHIIKNFLSTYFLLGERSIDRDIYRECFDLNEKELDNIKSLEKQREAFLKTPYVSKIVRLNVDPVSRALFSTDANDKTARTALIKEHGFEKGIELLAEAV